MKAVFLLGGVFFSIGVFAQEVRPGKEKVDSAHLEEIYKTPMDTTHLLNPDSLKFNHDTTLYKQDSIIRSKTKDDSDPKRPPK